MQYAVKANQVFVIEANPRASRTVPFVAKATGVPLAKVASRVMVGATLAELRIEGLLRDRVESDHIAIKEAVLPFNRFPEADALLGPEMRSTGEVMGIDLTPGLAFVKAQLAAGTRLPESGTDLHVARGSRQGPRCHRGARSSSKLGFGIVATEGTSAGDSCGRRYRRGHLVVAKLGDHEGVHAVDLIRQGDVQMVVNSPRGRGPRADGDHIRSSAAGLANVPLLTTGAAAVAAARGMRDWNDYPLRVRSLQEYHRGATTDQLSDRAGIVVIDTTTWVGSVGLSAPVLTASGTAGHGAEFARYMRPAELGAVVVKSMKADAWAGNPSPRVHPTPGRDDQQRRASGQGRSSLARARASRPDRHRGDYRRQHLGQLRSPTTLLPPTPWPTRRHQVVAVEVNVSCPNLEDRSRMFAHSAAATAEVPSSVTGGCGRPRWAKLSPNAADLPEIAIAASRGRR